MKKPQYKTALDIPDSEPLTESPKAEIKSKDPKKFPWPTVGGYDFYEALSALQKAVRRGNEKAALYWATELDLSDYSSHLWSRLRVIASEDVGLADSNVAVQIGQLFENWKCGNEARLFLVHAVLILARAPKSRIVDNALMCVYNKREPKPEIPDYALDKHTERGRKMGRGIQHFFDEGAKLENGILPDPYQDKAREIMTKKGAE